MFVKVAVSKNKKIRMEIQKIVNSYIRDEHLKERPNFRYKKVNIIMGAKCNWKDIVWSNVDVRIQLYS